jgi:hypothetical protein
VKRTFVFSRSLFLSDAALGGCDPMLIAASGNGGNNGFRPDQNHDGIGRRKRFDERCRTAAKRQQFELNG